jgi:hypothetical protein
MSYISIEIPELYPYVLGVAGLLAIECLLFGFVASKNRRIIFSKEFMDQFNDRHQEELG